MTSIPHVHANVLQSAQQQIQQDLQLALNAFSIPEPLKGAVHHAVMLGGKRVRPALCYATSHLKPNHPCFAAARRAAVAIELIHCYSLAHDDLPCMDNDLLRRGQPTCHVALVKILHCWLVIFCNRWHLKCWEAVCLIKVKLYLLRLFCVKFRF